MASDCCSLPRLPGHRVEGSRVGRPGRSQPQAPGFRTAPCLPRVVVKFRDSGVLPYEEGVEDRIERLGLGPWRALRGEFPAIRISRLYHSLEPEEIRILARRAVERDASYDPPDFLTCFAVECPPCVNPEALAEVLTAWPSLEYAEAEGRLGPPPGVNAAANPRSVRQGYLDPAPEGIDARFAWASVDPGGGGEGVGFVDMERGWTLNHEDLHTAGIELISGVNQDCFGHGTRALGVVVAVDNTIGDVGIAPHARARVISEWRSTGLYNRADAIMDAAHRMSPGDVLLLETQFWPTSGWQPLPAEARAAVFEAMRLAAALGIVVIEPAGNGWHDLDGHRDRYGRQSLNRLSPDFQDSGAIMVAAASSAAPHSRHDASSFGSRVDCYAWGEDVETLTTDLTGTAIDQYTDAYGGTSGAAAIVAGAALIVQSVAEARLGRCLSPREMRALLSDPASGTASADPGADRIGVMPDLRKILKNQFGITETAGLPARRSVTAPHTGPAPG